MALTESFCSTDPAIARHFAHVTFLSDNRSDLSKVTVPTLVIQCAEDVIAPTQVGEYVHDRIPGSTLAYVTSTGHLPAMSGAAELIGVIRDYLR